LRYLKYVLFILIMVFVPNVYAQEFNVSTSDITCPLTSGSGKYCGAEVYYTGTSAAYNIGTRYDGRLNRIWFNLIAGGYADTNGFEKGHTYTVSMNMATNDWNNKFGSVSVKCEGSSGTELVKGGITYVSYKKIKFTFQAPANDWCQFVYVDIRASSGNTITQIKNWNLSSLTISDSAYDSGSSGGSGGSGTTTDPNQSIIDANNENTSQIIDNQNQNTNDIISSIQETTQQVSDTITNVFTDKCDNLFNTTQSISNLSINSSGDFITDQLSFINYVEVESGKTYTISSNQNRQWVYNFSTDVPVLNSSGGTRTVTSGSSITFTVPSGMHYFNLRGYPDSYNSTEHSLSQDIMLVEGSTSKSYCEFNSIEQNKIDELNDKLDGLGRVIEDSQIDDKTSFFTGFTDNTHGLSGIISIPLTAIQNLANSQCQPLSLPLPFSDTEITLPCMSEYYEEHIPTLYALVQTLIYGFMAYRILIDIFSMVKGFKDPDNDKIEVLDL